MINAEVKGKWTQETRDPGTYTKAPGFTIILGFGLSGFAYSGVVSSNEIHTHTYPHTSVFF